MPPGDPEYSICEIFRGNHAVGLGFAIDRTHVATCAHVVNSALGRDKRNPARPGEGTKIRVRFVIGTVPGNDGYRAASVAGWLPAEAGTFDTDDIAVLELPLPAPAHVRVLRPAQHQSPMRVQMWGPQPRRPGGGYVQGELLREVPGGLIQINVSRSGRFRVYPGASGGPVWNLDGRVAGVLSAFGVEDDATDAYLLPIDRVRAAWPGWSPDEPSQHKPPPGGDKKPLLIRRRHAGRLESSLFAVFIDTEQKGRVADGETATFDVTPGRHKVQVKCGDLESTERTVTVWTNCTLTTKPGWASGTAARGRSSHRPGGLELRPEGEAAAIAVLLSFVSICLVVGFFAGIFGLLYSNNVSFADYVTDRWHWYGSPWSVAAGECLHDDTQTYSSVGPMVVVPCFSAAADYKLLGVFTDPANGPNPGCEYVTGWSAAAGGKTVFGDDFGHPGETLCAMPR